MKQLLAQKFTQAKHASMLTAAIGKAVKEIGVRKSFERMISDSEFDGFVADIHKRLPSSLKPIVSFEHLRDQMKIQCDAKLATKNGQKQLNKFKKNK